MSRTGIFSVCTEDLEVAITVTDFISAFDSGDDFVQLFPPELSNKLFSYLPDKDIYSCSKCSFFWRQVINNSSQWKMRCTRRGWCTTTGNKTSAKDPLKWTCTTSHVGEEELMFRPTPLFYLPPVASLRMGSLCDWALYFRQCLHREFNWKYGRYVIHKMNFPPDTQLPVVYNTCACNGRLFAAGTTLGHVLLWSVVGQPIFIKNIQTTRRRSEIELIQMTDTHMAILCQAGILLVYNVSELPINGREPYEVLYQIRVGGQYLNPDTYHLVLETMSTADILIQDTDGDGGVAEQDNILIWIRQLFHERLVLDADYTTSDIFFSISHHHKILLTGLHTEAVFVVDVHTGNLLRRLSLPSNMQVCFKCQVKNNNKKLYLSTRRVIGHQIEEATFHLLVYDLDTYEVTDFQSRSVLEEIQADEDDKRVAWVGQDCLIVGKDLITKATLFIRMGRSYIDNLTVYNDLILYHQYNGFIMGMDWKGVSKYEIEMRCGIVRGLDSGGSDQFLVSGGDERNLSIWNRQTGQKFHQVHQQPCRISRLWVDQTKIITLGREDPPVLIGYW